MYKRIAEIASEPLNGKILGVSGLDFFRPLISSEAEVIETEYPTVDMLDLPYSDGSFDYVISDQVIEHVIDPKKAIVESFRVLKEGGVAIHTTCFINFFHPCPHDFWRFSSEALTHLCSNFTEILQSDGWGNRLAIMLCFLSDRLRFMKIPDKPRSVRHKIATWNERGYPIVTWIVAKK